VEWAYACGTEIIGRNCLNRKTAAPAFPKGQQPSIETSAIFISLEILGLHLSVKVCEAIFASLP